jgi:hypothetical protein
MTEDEDGVIHRFRLNGDPQKYPIEKYPYSYDLYAVWDSGDWSESDGWAYSDRLRNYANYDEVKPKYLDKGDDYSYYDPEVLSNFLSELFGYKVRMTGIEEGCNVYNGYRIWLLWFRKV